MLRALHTLNVGPAHELALTPLGARVNLLTGDNGLGKSFLLELAWWALTRVMSPTSPILPAGPGDAMVKAEIVGEDGREERFLAGRVPRRARWVWEPHNPDVPHSLVLYARMDGSFWLWDPLRNLGEQARATGEVLENPNAYYFSTGAVLDGLKRDVRADGVIRTQTLCNGLIHDWVLWQQSGDERFRLFETLLGHLQERERPLRVGEPTRIGLQDDRLIPTLVMYDRQTVPLTIAPAGVLRIVKLAYLLTWAFSAHRHAQEALNAPATRQLVVLLDEPETHLHPAWQRTLLPSLLNALQAAGPAEAQVQLLVATHSPLVLASMEPLFDPQRDALWKLDLVGRDVVLTRDDWRRRGDVSAWLRSDVFDLGEARSVEAEQAIQAASALLSARRVSRAQVDEVDQRLGRTIGELDPIWTIWSQIKRGLEVVG
jgi:hypothetical protein